MLFCWQYRSVHTTRLQSRVFLSIHHLHTAMKKKSVNTRNISFPPLVSSMLSVIHAPCHPHSPYLSTASVVWCVPPLCLVCHQRSQQWSSGTKADVRAGWLGGGLNTKQRWFATFCEVVSVPGCAFGEGEGAGGERLRRWGHQGPLYLPGAEFLMRKAPTNAWAAWCCHPGIFYHWSNISRQLL